MIGHSEFPAASYDRWKTRSPDDEYDYEPYEPDPCEHEDYEIDWQGTWECHQCGEQRMASSAEIERWDRIQRNIAIAERRERSLFWSAWRWARVRLRLLNARWLRWRHPLPPIDDEIPF